MCAWTIWNNNHVMPELPEVETTRRALEPYLLNRTILAVRHNDPGKYKNTLDAIGRRVIALDRRGKYLIFRLEADDPNRDETGLDVIVHLKMTGGFRFPEPGPHFLEAPRFERLRLETDVSEVSYVDARRFGFWEVVPRNGWAHIASLANMGPEPLGNDFRLEPFALAMSKISRVKPALLSQKPVAGVGNIYADESLWLSKIHPEAGKLKPAQAKRLHNAIQTVMARAVAAGGSTLSDNSYQQPDGNPGYFQLEHAVYDRANQPCNRCGTPIEKYWLAGRGTHFCPQCQRL
jgi:formamidopyrimidine-DNA glycosylase